MAKLMNHGARREAEAAVTKRTMLLALGMLGLATASAAIALVVCDPPGWLDSNAYFLAVSGVFFTGVAELSSAVWVLSTGRSVVGGVRKMLVCGTTLLVVAAIGLSLASFLQQLVSR